jgi:hypothetical protein
MIREPKVEFLPDQQTDFPFSVDGPWYLVVLVAAMIAIAAVIWRRRRR